MFAGLHPTIMLDLASSTAVDRRRSERARDQRAAGRRAVADPTRATRSH